MPHAPEHPQDREFLDLAIENSRRSLLLGSTAKPFGAVVVVGGEVVGEGVNSVVAMNDPTAHAEVMALRDAGRRLGRISMGDAVLYASSEPCPMCLVACYWAGIPRVVYGATTRDAAANGHEDLRFYRDIALPSAERRMLDEVAVEGASRSAAVEVLAAWAAAQPGPVEPKL
ncbi:nucleoside deaminase [Streptomyces alfalfae]|uniref:nucleoside deaminase n=1 Tax=Streptomyces alfalfae TaxID=1642299 RepID=UPI001BAA1763|nr:nucleoside deaminase [Streptomyces alfalfae]QUI31927.1 nucleoside deaminase [Streptomyces alfalfae]